MLKLSQNIIDLPIMSLRTGGRVGTATIPIINPNNLQIEGWHCTDIFSNESLVLLKSNMRDFVPQGIAVDDHEAMTDPEDIIRLKEILEINFELISKPVITDSKRRLGKVADYAIDPLSLKVQKLYVSRPVYKSLTDGQLSIDRSQIVEITNKKVVIRDVDIKIKSAIRRPLTATS